MYKWCVLSKKKKALCPLFTHHIGQIGLFTLSYCYLESFLQINVDWHWLAVELCRGAFVLDNKYLADFSQRPLQHSWNWSLLMPSAISLYNLNQKAPCYGHRFSDHNLTHILFLTWRFLFQDETYTLNYFSAKSKTRYYIVENKKTQTPMMSGCLCLGRASVLRWNKQTSRHAAHIVWAALFVALNSFSCAGELLACQWSTRLGEESVQGRKESEEIVFVCKCLRWLVC